MKRLQIFAVLILTASLDTACSRPEAPEPEMSAEEARNALAARAGAQLFDGMGNHHHPITTKDPDAQRYFDQGLVNL